MLEIDFLPVGDGKDSGDAIALRFTRPDTGTLAHVVVDAGFKDDGEALVSHFDTHYDTDVVDLALLTHPDGDHIGGMGEVLRGLRVRQLGVHHLHERGGAGLPAADAVEELISVAEEQGTVVVEPFAGDQFLGGALTVLGPDLRWYEELVAEQQSQALSASGGRSGTLLETVRRVGERLVASMPVEIPFDEGEGTNPRNLSSMISLLEVAGHRALLTADAGVPSLQRAWDWLEVSGLGSAPLDFVQVPHHGSRRNVSSEVLDRILGPIGQARDGSAIASVVSDHPKHPSPRVVNAFRRRGYPVTRTADRHILHRGPDTPLRTGWRPVEPLGPMDESDED